MVFPEAVIPVRPSALRALPGRRYAGAMGSFLATVVCLGLSHLASASPTPSHEASSVPARPVFERDIRPLFKTHCFQCHGEDEKTKGGVDLRQRRRMLSDASKGKVLVPGQPGASRLWDQVNSGEMPKGGKKLAPNELALLERWIRRGAPTLRPEPDVLPPFVITEEERQFWAFQPIRKPTVPKVRSRSGVRTPIDSFVVARLEQAGLRLAKPASPESLIRRVTFDLTGLPPTPEEVAAFVADPSDAGYGRLVDRLLGSSPYGERWGRHWLDVAGYADSNGGVEADTEREWAWRYRDYVIRAFNADKPFSEFITEQLAGDELLPADRTDLSGPDLDRLIATGFLRMAPDPTGDNPPDADLARNQVIADTVQIVSSSLLGMTVQCAQCHDHRYDPIPQSDYYRLRAVFEPAFDWKHWKNPAQRLVSLMPAVDRMSSECIETSARLLDSEATRLHDELIERFVQKQLLLVPESDRVAVLAARRTAAGKRSPEQLQLLRHYPTFQDHIILGEIDREGANRVEEVRKRATTERAVKPVDPRVHCLVEDPGTKVETVLFHRGDHQQPKGTVQPGLLMAMGLGGLNLDIPGSSPGLRTTGRRLELARRLTDRSNPLTARVWVNRIWLQHFGVGLVATPGNFGALGERPSHPELLEWLADDFMANGWKTKRLHRLIVTSAAYRQGSVNVPAQKADPDNRLLGRFRLRRLDAESLRDGMLAVSGRLDPLPYGPPVPVAVTPQGQFVVGRQKRDGNGDSVGVDPAGSDAFRRSVYVQVRRTMPVGVLETFDAPVVNPNCELRSASTVAPQSLMLLNDGFVLERSADLAARLLREQPADSDHRISRLWSLLFASQPTDRERRRALEYVNQQIGLIPTATTTASKTSKPTNDAKDPKPPTDPSLPAWASLCQVLMGSNRFLYLD